MADNDSIAALLALLPDDLQQPSLIFGGKDFHNGTSS